MEPFEIVEHTADIGIRAYGRTKEELFVHAAQGMFGLIVLPQGVRPERTIPIQARADGWENLLVAWLRELLYRFDAQHFVGKEFRIRRLDPGSIEAEVAGETLDLKRHAVEREVKAVTYCDLRVEQRADGVWTAQVIFDI